MYSGEKIQSISSFYFMILASYLLVSQLITYEVFILNVLLIYYRFLDDVIYMFEELFSYF